MAGLTYPYSRHDRLLAGHDDLDLEFSPGVLPPSGSAGGAGRFKYWVDNTDVNNGVLRQCVVTRATAGSYVPAEWITLGVIDAANHKFHFNTDNVDFTGGSGTLTVHDLTVTGATHLNTLDVSGATNLNTLAVAGTLSVGGASALHALGVTGNLDVTGNINGASLGITGTSSLHDTTVTGNLAVTGAITGASLSVTGAVSSAGLTTTGDLTVGGKLIVNGPDSVINQGLVIHPKSGGSEALQLTADLGVTGQIIATGQITGSTIASSGQVTGAEVHSAGVITGTTITGSTLNSSGGITAIGTVEAAQYDINFSSVDYSFATIGHDPGVGDDALVIFGPDFSTSGSGRLGFYKLGNSYQKSNEHNFWSLTGAFTTYAVFNAGGTSNISGSWNVISDDTVKENVTPYTKGLAEVLQLNPVGFNYYTPGTTGFKWSPFADVEGTAVPTVHYGLMASNAKSVLPEMVSEISYSDIGQGLPSTPLATTMPTHLVYVLTNAVKELAEQDDDLGERLTVVEGYTPPTIVLSGDITGSGTAAITTTLRTTNSSPGVFQGLTINAKGLVTAASNMGYAPLVSPAFTGTPTAPTPVNSDASSNLATTAFVRTGTVTNDSAAAGQISEFISGQLLSTAAITLTNNVDTSIATISLSAGEWEVWGSGGFILNANNATQLKVWINPTGATAAPALDQLGGLSIMPITNNVTQMIMPVTSMRVSLASTTTMRLGVTGTFTGTISAYGKIMARRVR